MQEPRQLYGLGSFVKKITKPIKKVIKSPIGKAALAGAAVYFGGGGGLPQFMGGKGAAGFGSNAFGALIKRGLLGAKTAAGERGITREGGLLGLLKGGLGNLSGGQKAFLLGGAGLSLLPFLTGGPEEEEEVVEEGFDVTPGTIQNIVAQARARDPSLRFLPQTQFARPGFFTAAEGGIAELPQVRMLEGGVPEIDYRQSGGFVPMGKKEKADDVPAMLSKNEFVMTADAVRGMGDGNVEKGAQRMYDQMRQLENRVV
jgi:hypothetical protein